MLHVYVSQLREERYFSYSFLFIHKFLLSIIRINRQSFPVNAERPCSELDFPVLLVRMISPTVEVTLIHRGTMPHAVNVSDTTMIKRRYG
jgi:hypothetical protein|tara:strand:+ start:1323 stop:1592 length:270 start_codon:yes stop_codon:yes gene_type:complete